MHSRRQWPSGSTCLNGKPTRAPRRSLASSYRSGRSAAHRCQAEPTFSPPFTHFISSKGVLQNVSLQGLTSHACSTSEISYMSAVGWPLMRKSMLPTLSCPRESRSASPSGVMFLMWNVLSAFSPISRPRGAAVVKCTLTAVWARVSVYTTSAGVFSGVFAVAVSFIACACVDPEPPCPENLTWCRWSVLIAIFLKNR